MTRSLPIYLLFHYEMLVWVRKTGIFVLSESSLRGLFLVTEPKTGTESLPNLDVKYNLQKQLISRFRVSIITHIECVPHFKSKR